MSKPLGQTTVRTSGSKRAWEKKFRSASGSETPRQSRPAKLMSPTSPSPKETRSW
jgi:hypothetical protein